MLTRVSKRAEYMFALYSGSLAEPGDANPYTGSESLVLPQLWMRGYMRMLRVRIATGPAMETYMAARGGGGRSFGPRVVEDADGSCGA